MPVVIQGPKTADGKLIHLVNLFPGDVSTIFTGRGDDITNGVRWAGTSFNLSKSGNGAVVVEWQFLEWVYLAGGGFSETGGKGGDHISFKIYAPSSISAETNNPGAGEYSKINVGGGVSIYVKPGTPGAGPNDFDLDLSAKLNVNVGFTKVVPVPAREGDGLFDWDPETETVTKNEDNTGLFNLCDAPIDLSRFLVEMPLVKDGDVDLTIPAIEPKRVLPHWVYRLDFHRQEAGTVDLAWYLYIARRITI